MIVGIDIGGTTTKVVGFREAAPVDFLTVTASDPLTSASGGLGRFLTVNGLPISSIGRIVVTGAGSSWIRSDLLGVPTTRVDEFRAIGLGGLYLSGLPRAIVVSMGTGTAIVRASEREVVHLGGTGVGGGTLVGLSRLLLNTADFQTIDALSATGSLAQVDLTVGDISQTAIGDLPPDITAANFGKLGDQPGRGDLALGIVNMVLQTIGLLAIFAARCGGDRDVVLTGKLAGLGRIREITRRLGDLFRIDFHIPERADYATAIGAALTAMEGSREDPR
jgi:type II pantothenate kinase